MRWRGDKEKLQMGGTEVHFESFKSSATSTDVIQYRFCDTWMEMPDMHNWAIFVGTHPYAAAQSFWWFVWFLFLFLAHVHSRCTVLTPAPHTLPMTGFFFMISSPLRFVAATTKRKTRTCFNTHAFFPEEFSTYCCATWLYPHISSAAGLHNFHAQTFWRCGAWCWAWCWFLPRPDPACHPSGDQRALITNFLLRLIAIANNIKLIQGVFMHAWVFVHIR